MATATSRDPEFGTAEDQPIPEGWHRAVLDMAPDAFEFFERLAFETQSSKAEVLSKALALYYLALKARREGKIVGAAGDDQEIETEFVGF